VRSLFMMTTTSLGNPHGTMVNEGGANGVLYNNGAYESSEFVQSLYRRIKFQI